MGGADARDIGIGGYVGFVIAIGIEDFDNSGGFVSLRRRRNACENRERLAGSVELGSWFEGPECGFMATNN
jgi:hypothetical protein